MLPALSAAGPAPAFQNAPSLPFGVTLRTLVWASVFWLYPMTHPVYGRMSQCDDQAVYTIPLSRRRPGRSLYCLGSKVTAPPMELSPEPGNVAATAFGPPSISLPVVRSRACRR